MTRRELSLWVFGALILVSARWAFSFPLYEPVVSPAATLAAAEATQPTQGSTAANTYCKSLIGKVEDLSKVECSDEEASGVVVRGHCTTSGGCQVTEYKCPDETWKKISDRTACALQPAAPVPASDETGFQAQPAVGQVAPLPQQSLNQINTAFENGAKPLDAAYAVNPVTGQLESLSSEYRPAAPASDQSSQSFNYAGPSNAVSDLGNPVSRVNEALGTPQTSGSDFSAQSGFGTAQETAAEQKPAEQGGSWWSRVAQEACNFFTFGLACSSAQAGNSRTDAEVIAAAKTQNSATFPQQPAAIEQTTQQGAPAAGAEVKLTANTTIEYPSGDSVRPTVLAGELSQQQADKLQAQAQAFETQRQQVVANTGWGTGLSVDCPGVCRTVTENGVTQPRSAYNATVDTQISTLKAQADQWQARAAFFNSSDSLAVPTARTLIEGGTRATLVEGNLDAMLRARAIVQAGQSVSGVPYGDTEVSASIEKANYSRAQLERLTSGGDFTQTEKDVIRKSNPNNLTAEEFNAELKTQKYAGTLSGTIYNAVTSINNPTAAQQQSRLFLSDSEIAQQQAGDVTKASLAVGADALVFAAMTPPGVRVLGAGINALGLGPALDAFGSGVTRVGSAFLDPFEMRAFTGWARSAGITDLPVSYSTDLAVYTPAEGSVPLTTLEKTVALRESYSEAYLNALRDGDTAVAEMNLNQWRNADSAAQRLGGTAGMSPEDIPSAPLHELSAGVNSGALRGGESPIVDGLGIYRGAPGQWPVLVRENGSRVMTEGTSGTWLTEASTLVKTDAQYQRLIQEYYGDNAKFSYLSDGSMTVRNGEGIPRQTDPEVYEELRRIGLRVAPGETDVLQPSLSVIDSTALEIAPPAPPLETQPPQPVATGATLDMRIMEGSAWAHRDVSIEVGTQLSQNTAFGTAWEGTMTDKTTGEVSSVVIKEFKPEEVDWGHMLDIVNVHSSLQQAGLPVPKMYAVTSDVSAAQQFAVMENLNTNGFVALGSFNENLLVPRQSIGDISNFADAARSTVQSSLRLAEQGYVAPYDAYFGVVSPNTPTTPMTVVVGDLDQIKPVAQDVRDPVGRAAEENIMFANKFLRGFVFEWVRSAEAVGEYVTQIRNIIAEELEAWNARRNR